MQKKYVELFFSDSKNALAKVHKDLLKNENRPSAPKNREGLTSKQAEGTSSQSMS